MPLVIDPFASEFMQRALLGGLIVGILSAVVGTWVVLRGMAFLGEAMSHGMLPGVAVAVLLGLPGQLGALVAAGAMAVGINAVTRRTRVAHDTVIGIIFVAMLSLGVLIVSAAREVPINLTAILFGDILAMSWADVVVIAAAAALVMVVFAWFQRPFTALVFDRRIAHTLGMRPKLASTVLMSGVAIAIVASYQAVGTLLVVGLLLAPAATGALWARSITQVTIIGMVAAAVAVFVGLSASWYLGVAAGPAVALASVLIFGVSVGVRRVT